MTRFAVAVLAKTSTVFGTVYEACGPYATLSGPIDKVDYWIREDKEAKWYILKWDEINGYTCSHSCNGKANSIGSIVGYDGPLTDQIRHLLCIAFKTWLRGWASDHSQAV